MCTPAIYRVVPSGDNARLVGLLNDALRAGPSMRSAIKTPWEDKTKDVES